jgi:hypothetical protein
MGDRMRFYGKKFLSNKTLKQIQAHRETKDAIVWSVDPVNKIAFVRIQGSSTNIVAKYPENWEQTPVWLKPGNAVKINFTGGDRGRVELIGHGFLIPTPTDDTAAQPDPQVVDDAPLTGMLVYPIPLNQRMAVMVKVGTFRIGGSMYTLGPIAMDQYDDWYMNDGGTIGQVAAIIDIDPPEGYYRHDWIVVGPDLIVDYIKGTPFTTTPVDPTLPTGHIFLNQIFVYPGMTKVGYSDIGKSFAEPMASGLLVTITNDELEWLDTSTTIKVQVIDQYGSVFNLSGGCYCVMKMLLGNGTISGTDATTSTIGVGVGSYVYSGSYANFIYTRGGGIDDESPILQIEMQNATAPVSTIIRITLLNEEGDPM